MNAEREALLAAMIDAWFGSTEFRKPPTRSENAEFFARMERVLTVVRDHDHPERRDTVLT